MSWGRRLRAGPSQPTLVADERADRDAAPGDGEAGAGTAHGRRSAANAGSAGCSACGCGCGDPASAAPGTAAADAAAADVAADVAASADPPTAAVEAVAGLEAAVDRLLGVEVAELDDAAVDVELTAVERAARRLDARRCRLAAATASRRAAQAESEAAGNGQDRFRAGLRARRQAEQDLAERHRWSRSEAKRATSIGQQLGADEQAQAAFDRGALPPRHAKLLADTLQHLDQPQRDQLAQRLLAAAGVEDAVTFGRTCRRALAELDAAAAMRGEERRHQRRRASVTGTDDGMLTVSGQWSGVDAETVATAIEAFRHPDPPGTHRTAGQRTADAVVELARAALRAGEQPTVHGVRPQVTVLLDYQTLLADAAAVDTGQPGAAAAVELPWTGPVPYPEVRRLLADAGVSRLLVDPTGVPLEAGEQTRNVPAGLWRALVARDRGCIAEGCDTPPGWCDVMHLQHPYHLDGRLSLANGALGCRHHHRNYDLHNWQIHWRHHRPRLRPPPT